MTTEECDAEMQSFKNRIIGLKYRYQTLKTFREFGSKTCKSKLYETKCEATNEFFRTNVASFFVKNKSSVVMVKVDTRTERPFTAQDSVQMTPKILNKSG